MKINQTSDGQGLGLGTQLAPVKLEFKTSFSPPLGKLQFLVCGMQVVCSVESNWQFCTKCKCTHHTIGSQS